MRYKFILIPLASVAFFACSKDQNQPVCSGETPTYTDTIKSLVDNSCALAGCHGTGSGIGDFSSYNGLKPYLEDGHFEHHVLKKQDMPPSGPLKEGQLSIIQCWLENNYAE